jgi:hypothetical protein
LQNSKLQAKNSNFVPTPPSSILTQIPPSSILTHNSPPTWPTSTLSNISDLVNRPAVVVGRQLEMLNIFLGYEQANKYVIYDAQTATPLAYLLEDESTMTKMLMRQFLRSHRPFTAIIMGLDGRVLMKMRRPLQLVNSRVSVFSHISESGDDDEDELLGVVQQRWHLWRRRYDIIEGYVKNVIFLQI